MQLINRATAPGRTALAYAFNQARAKLLSGVRIIKASFDVPWEDVRSIMGCERVRIADEDIPGGEMVGKVTAVDVDLVRGIANISIAAAPGSGGNADIPDIPPYLTQPIGGAAIVYAGVQNDFDTVYNKALTYNDGGAVKIKYTGASDPTITMPDYFQKALDYIKDADSEIKFAMSPVPKGSDLTATIDCGVVGLDCAKMIDLEAE